MKEEVGRKAIRIRNSWYRRESRRRRTRRIRCKMKK